MVKQPFEAQVPTQRVFRGSPVLVECLINPNYMKDYLVVTSWLRDESFNILPAVASASSESGHYYMLSDGRLIIWQVTMQDSYSSFKCRLLHRLTGEAFVSSAGKVIVTGM